MTGMTGHDDGGRFVPFEIDKRIAAGKRDSPEYLAAFEREDRRRGLASELQAKREALGLSRADVAVAARTSVGTVGRAERDADVSLSVLQRIAHAVGHKLGVS